MNASSSEPTRGADASAASTQTTKRVLLAGCGDLNTTVGLSLHEQGWRVTGLQRSAEDRRLPFTVVSQDLAEISEAGVLPDADAVVIALTADSYDADGYTRAYRHTVRGLAAGFSNPPARVVLVSSTGVLGDQGRREATEAAEPRPASETAQVLLEAESDARELFPDSVVTVVRAAGIYGPGRNRTVEQVRQQNPADHSRMTNRIHRDDLVTAITMLVDHQYPPPLVHAVDTEPAPLGEVLEFCADRMGLPTPPNRSTGELSGNHLDASLLHQLMTEQRLKFVYPTFREGYAALIPKP